jgi:hypothetical protein
MIYYPGEDGRLQMALIPWSKSIDFRMPVSVWQQTIAHYYPGTAWIAIRAETFEALQKQKLARGLATLDSCIADLLQTRDDD